MKRASIFFFLALLCLGTAAGCKERTGRQTVEGSPNEDKELKPKMDAAAAKDGKEIGEEVVAAWRNAGLTSPGMSRTTPAPVIGGLLTQSRAALAFCRYSPSRRSNRG